MIRFLFRFVGLLLLALAFILFVYDGTKWIADQSLHITTVSDGWAIIHQNSLLAAQPMVEHLTGPWFWRSIVQRYFLDQPAWLVLAILAAILILLGRKRKPLIGYARD